MVRNSAPTTLREHAVGVLANFTPLANRWQQELHAAVATQVPLQVCLRDIWRPHVLFTHDEVTGMIDYGALNMDSVAADIARLFDSLLGEDVTTWNIALSAYEAVRPLLSMERTLVAAYQKSSILLTGMQWVTWLFREGRQFAPGHAEQRLQLALARMQTHQILVTDGS
jgi:homoserine kinase type II